MEPIFTDKQLNNMSREDLISLMKIVQEQTKMQITLKRNASSATAERLFHF